MQVRELKKLLETMPDDKVVMMQSAFIDRDVHSVKQCVECGICVAIIDHYVRRENKKVMLSTDGIHFEEYEVPWP